MNKAFTKYIQSNTPDSHQVDPHWIITFIRFNTRDTKNYKKLGPENYEPTRDALVVENDCITVSVSTSKTNYTPSVSATFTGGDINYSTAINPGDFMFVNIVNSSVKARELRERIKKGEPINRVGDGFKGFFRVNNVGKIINTDPASGQKVLRYQVTGYGFLEFQNIIYYNPSIGPADQNAAYGLSPSLIDVIGQQNNVQTVIEIMTSMILGQGAGNAATGVFASKSQPYELPSSVFDLLGIEGKYAIDAYRLMLGIWTKFSYGQNTFQDNTLLSSTDTYKDYAKVLQKGFNPDYSSNQGKKSFQKTNKILSGYIAPQTTSLVNVSLIDLIKRFSNDLLNETYACFRVDKDFNAILPKLIVRQKPFNTEHFKSEGSFTRFMSLPRWKISADLIYNLNISKTDSLRFNFVHIITQPTTLGGAESIQAYANSIPPQFDEKDMRRNGIRPYTSYNNFDWVTNNSVGNAAYWNKLCFDWVYGGHLKTNGTLSCVGIEDDICIGDNLELEDTVYHIESINHIASINAEGYKSFKTNITLTNGVDKRTGAQGPVYPEMDFSTTYEDRTHNYEEQYGIMPGYSDSQDILNRSNAEETKKPKSKTFTKNGLKNKIIKSDKDKN
jgi:hypothetical protein